MSPTPTIHHQASAPRGAFVTLSRAWNLLGADPVRLLGLSAAILGLDALLGWLAWRWFLGGDPLSYLLWGLGLRIVVGGPIELLILSYGAEASDGHPRSSRAPLRAAPWWLLERSMGWFTGLTLAAPALAGALVLASTGAVAASALVASLAGVVFWAGQAVGRAPLAMVPVWIVATDAPAPRALRASWLAGPRAWLSRAVVLGIVGLLRGVGTALGLAPALPTVSLASLVLLRRLHPENGCDPCSQA